MPTSSDWSCWGCMYPEVPRSEACQCRDEARRQIEDGRDPGAERQANKHRAKGAADNTFEAEARKPAKPKHNTVGRSDLLAQQK